ncbi:unnamed protein product [Durusdinium trenchii]|uniref:Lipocalin/cytosolic fatty-acid binding domain-containing protein n=1 Tax=Durusdinium trenchii TaxID=1381693 RepID=A0ABP0KFX2_9DINO
MARLLRRPLLRRARPVAVAVFVMAPLLGAWSARAMAKPPLMAMEKTMDLKRFMGSWYVLAHIPVRLVKEHLAHNAVETYSWDEAKERISVHYRFNENADDGPLNDSYQRGWVKNKETFAEWRVSPKLPIFGYGMSSVLRLPYIIVDCADDYNTAIVGYPNRAYLWILSRIEKSKGFGYDESKIRRVPQSEKGEVFQSPP